MRRLDKKKDVKRWLKTLKIETIDDAKRVLNSLAVAVVTKNIDVERARCLTEIVDLQLKVLELQNKLDQGT